MSRNNPIKGMVAGAKLAKVAGQVKNKAVTVGMVAKGIAKGIAHPNKTVKAIRQVKAVREMRAEVDRRLKDPKVQARLEALNGMMKKK